jgi:hypothetical protein
MSVRRPTPTRDHHEAFCTTEGWDLVRDARDRPTGHHVTYRLPLPDGRILRTRISRPVDLTEYGPALFGHILRDQLEVTAEEFWTCVSDGTAPTRTPYPIPADALPASLVFTLQRQLHLTDAEVASLTRTEALARLAEHWSQGPATM